ncbi:hypothetical protein IV203_023183 [Nitzschia inconspicua]|uniref:Uncharacterized protein n=1 Tax=Nitzschia inconspicua TaxID=303405 RepID=A0A9K3PB92_9STRA|nr:hypothetical protein IV203_023183 [Nitzschia inconspicua]
MTKTSKQDQQFVTMPDGTKVAVKAQKENKKDRITMAHLTSPNRVKLSEKDRMETEETIVSSHLTLKFKKMDLHSPDLDSLVSLNTNLETTERLFARYDLLQIFNIVKPIRDPSTGQLTGLLHDEKSFRNLFQWYGALTLAEVMESTDWYSSCLDDDWYGFNLDLTAEYLRCHMETDLYEKVNEEYSKLDIQGGPVLLFVMIRHLLSTNDSLVHALTSKIKAVKLSSYPGEDVRKAVTHLRTLVRCLKKLRRRNADGHEVDLVPHDLTKQLYDILQTSSCDEFNVMFKQLFYTEQRNVLLGGHSRWTDPEEVLTLAQGHYQDLCVHGKWTGATQNISHVPCLH